MLMLMLSQYNLKYYSLPTPEKCWGYYSILVYFCNINLPTRFFWSLSQNQILIKIVQWHFLCRIQNICQEIFLEPFTMVLCPKSGAKKMCNTLFYLQGHTLDRYLDSETYCSVISILHIEVTYLQVIRYALLLFLDFHLKYVCNVCTNIHIISCRKVYVIIIQQHRYIWYIHNFFR